MTEKALQPMISAIVVGAAVIEVAWEDGTRMAVDLSGIAAWHPPLSPLTEPGFFRLARLSDDGFAVEWSDDVDVSGVQLWRWGHEQAGLYMPAADFRAWMERNGLSYVSAANSLGLSRRMIAYYASGEKPVTLTVKLATIGWESLNRGAA